MPDQQLIVIASDDPFILGVLSSKAHLAWSAAMGGTLENRERYNNSLVFDTFPFPNADAGQRARIGSLADELDANRKDVLATHADLTLTVLYNLRAKLLSGDPLDLVEQDQRRRGRIDLLAELHQGIDEVVTDAYDWPVNLSDADVVNRLAKLNAERRAEEKRGHVQWLRPEFQLRRAHLPIIAAAPQSEQIVALLPAARTSKPAFPRDAIGQTAAVLDALRSGEALSATDIAVRFTQGRRTEPRIAATLAALARLGHVAVDAGTFRLRRAA